MIHAHSIRSTQGRRSTHACLKYQTRVAAIKRKPNQRNSQPKRPPDQRNTRPKDNPSDSAAVCVMSYETSNFRDARYMALPSVLIGACRSAQRRPLFVGIVLSSCLQPCHWNSITCTASTTPTDIIFGCIPWLFSFGAK